MESPKHNYRVLFEALGAIGVALTALVVGFTIASGQWEANVNLLERSNNNLQIKLDKSVEQITNLKIQLSRALFENTGTSFEPMGYQSAPKDKQGSPIEVTVSEADTASLFDNKLFITVVTTNYSGSPPRYSVIGKIAASSKDTIEIESQEPGYSVVYEDYEIRILSAGTLSATFLVQKLK